MKNLTFGILISIFISACGPEKDNYLIRFSVGESDEMVSLSGYLNSKGDTIIPIGKYDYYYNDTIRSFGMVVEKGTGKILGIDQNGTELYEVFNYDNGPDEIQSGLFRIIKNEKIGYADPDGKIIIEPQFACAYPFDGDFAKVSDDCETVKEGEHAMWESENWYQITQNGNRAE